MDWKIVKLKPYSKKYTVMKGKVIDISKVVIDIPHNFLPPYNEIREPGVRFLLELNKPWDGPLAASFDIIL